MEENRLTPMIEGYDPKVFNKLYSKTDNLRRKLTSEIDHRRFGLSYEDILSWFDVKFIFAFNKYYDKYNEDILLGHLIRSLQFFKQRILRSAYTQKYSQSIVQVESIITLEDSLTENHPGDESNHDYAGELKEFMKSHLSANAYELLDVQLNPPPYILSKLNTHRDANLQKIPDEILLDYFDLGVSDRAYKYLGNLKKEIRNTINYAKLHFNNQLS